jgi:hypothetical protein
MTFKIKLEDKAAFLNRMETTDKKISSNQIKDNNEEKYFELVVTNPEQLEIVKSILNTSPKINTIKEMKKSLTKNELKEMIRQELNEKKKIEDKKKKMDEAVGGLTDPNFIAGAATLASILGTVGFTLIKQLKSTTDPEKKKNILQKLSNAIDNSMTGRTGGI